MSGLHKMHQLRCRYAHEIQQQQQQQQQPSGSLRSRLRSSLLEVRDQATAEATPATIANSRSSELRSREAQEMLQLRLAHFFNNLPAVPSVGRAEGGAGRPPDALPPSGRPARGRCGLPVARRRQPTTTTTTTTIADQLNTNSSVAMANSLLPLDWPPTGEEPGNTLSASLTANSLDMTEVSDITVRDGSPTCCVSPSPSLRAAAQQQLPSLATEPSPPQVPPRRQQQQQQQRRQHRMRSSSLANLMDRSCQWRGAAAPASTAAATAAAAVRPDFTDHMRLLLDDFRSATSIATAAAAAAGQVKQTQPETLLPQLSSPPPPPTAPSPPSRPHRRESRSTFPPGRSGAAAAAASAASHRTPGPRARSASASACGIGGPGRTVCQVFQITDVDAVRSTLVTKDDRRVVKILGQFDCKADIIDTVQMSPTRLASMVCVAAPDLEHLQWCIGRVEDIFPGWELKSQMRGYKCRKVGGGGGGGGGLNK